MLRVWTISVRRPRLFAPIQTFPETAKFSHFLRSSSLVGGGFSPGARRAWRAALIAPSFLGGGSKMRRSGKRLTQPKPVEVLPGQLAFCFDPPARRPQQRHGRWPGFQGRRAPAPQPDEQPLNTARAAKLLGKSQAWLANVRSQPDSPPWIKTGGVYHYFVSQLAWWRAQLNAG
jgi:hypothetical protein